MDKVLRKSSQWEENCSYKKGKKMTDNPITIEKEPSPAVSQFIKNELYQFNTEKTGLKFGGEVAAFIRLDTHSFQAPYFYKNRDMKSLEC